ncbi:MAG: apolipoprotein N-acyltransferase [Planctomycetota bacterium]|nr:apolipoprotein N-acyltransferase [Planctomycetota bacterium]
MNSASDSASTPARWPTYLLLLCMLLWVGAFTRDPMVLATVPGVLGFIAVVERARTTKQAFLILSLFGAIAIGTGYSWLADTMQLFGGLAPIPSYLATALFGVLGMAHGWVFIFVYRAMLARGNRPHPMSTAILICAVESIPGIRFFPWMVGHGAVNNAPLVQNAEWGGVSGVSFALLCLIVPFYEWIRWAFASTRTTARPKAALLTFAVGVGLYGWGMWRYADVNDAVREAEQTLRVGIVQANVGSVDKRAAENGVVNKDVLARRAYERGSREAADKGAELIVWPETAVTLPVPFSLGPRQADGYLANNGYRFIRELGQERAFLCGMYERYNTRRTQPMDGRRRGVDRYNTAALRQPGGIDAEWTTVRKVYLIPFGEYMPFGLPEEQFLPQNFKMRAGEGGQKPLYYRERTLVPFLCYEGILPDHVREACAGEAPDILVSLTNDSWFGDTWEPWQHLNFTRFRCVEHRAPMVRATNTGISAFVTPSGDVVKMLGLGLTDEKRGNPEVLMHDVRLVDHGRTIYASFGYMLPYALWVLALLGLLAALAKPPPITE